jgi:hypothetical protein
MNREDIIRMAREVGYPLVEYEGEPYIPPMLAILLKTAAAAEREACAKVCDSEATIEGIAQRCAAAIRARGEDSMPLFDDWGKDWK